MARYYYKYRPPQQRPFPIRTVLLLVVLAMLIALPFWLVHSLTIEEHVLKVADLPSNLKNLKIVYLSDIHQGAWFSRQQVNELIAMVNNLSADIVILGGDYASDSDGAIDFFQSMPAIHARLGVFAVMGDADRTEPESNLSLLVAAMKDAGCVPLVNAVSRVKVGQSYVYIAGADDYYNGTPDVESVASQVSSDDFVIFAGHSPDLMTDVLAAKSSDGNNHWFDLALFGHTHGGQINLFGYTPFSSLMPEIGSRYLSGWLEESRAAVLVSNGVGVTGLPMRLGAMPQIHLITLKKQ